MPPETQSPNCNAKLHVSRSEAFGSGNERLGWFIIILPTN